MKPFLIFLGIYFFWLIASLLILLILKKVFPARESHGPSILGKFLPFVLFQLLLFGAAAGGVWPLGFFLGICLFLGMAEFARIEARHFTNGSIVKWTGFIVIFVIFVISFFLILSTRHHDQDHLYAAKLFLLVALFDSFSQIVGEKMRGPLLFPKVSPHKTWSGLGGGFLFVFTGFLLFQFFPDTFFDQNAYQGWLAIPSLALLCLAALAGGAVASFIKRLFHLKDFSKLLGPSGGILDRIDSFLFLGLVMFFLTQY